MRIFFHVADSYMLDAFSFELRAVNYKSRLPSSVFGLSHAIVSLQDASQTTHARSCVDKI
jgi:hypothetical protein